MGLSALCLKRLSQCVVGATGQGRRNRDTGLNFQLYRKHSMFLLCLKT